MRLKSTFFALATSALVATACGGDANAPNNSHVGTYALKSVDKATLPVLIYEDVTTRVTLTGGSLSLNANNSFTETVRFELSLNGVTAPPEVATCDGTYRKSGNTVTMTVTATDRCDAATISGTLSGRVLTIDDNGTTLVFER